MVSPELEKAQQQLASGDDKGALKTLWRVEARARTSATEAQGLLEVATELFRRSSGGTRRDCEVLVGYAQGYLVSADLASADPAHDALAAALRCAVLASSGLEIRTGERRDLIFRDEGVLLRKSDDRDAEPLRIDWVGLAVDVAGAGQVRKGMRWFGGGFGLAGAAEGALIAAALTSLTSRTEIDTVIRLQMPAAELFLHYDKLAPQDLRMRWSPVFTRLRSAVAPTTGTAPAGDIVEQLHKAASLLERGLLTDEEFTRLKADLLR